MDKLFIFVNTGLSIDNYLYKPRSMFIHRIKEIIAILKL